MGDEDKQYDATPRKLEQARKEGQVVKSKDFSTAVSLLVVFLAIYGLSPFIWDQISKLFVLCYDGGGSVYFPRRGAEGHGGGGENICVI